MQATMAAISGTNGSFGPVTGHDKVVANPQQLSAETLSAQPSLGFPSAISKEQLEEAVEKAVDKANKILTGVPKKVEYSVHKAFGDIIVKVLNAETNEVIAEFPPEKILDIVANLIQLQGAIIDEKR
ncbi:MAG TPA: flagellar protein FlaG [Bacilli bacterium]